MNLLWTQCFIPEAPLPGGAGLGSLISIAVKYLGSDGMVCQKFRENYFIRESCVIMLPIRQSGCKQGNVLGLNSGREVPKPFLDRRS